MALALYRKYRPRTFKEVIGQEHVTEPLTQALRTGRLHHAYLFSGPRGCGKTSSARILARSLNCEKGPTPEPCGQCESCRALAPDGPGSIDVIEIDAASHGGVDDARDLRERAFFAPVASRFKVYVIDEAHMVTPQGFNALLKLVEEPPEYVKFVFATTEPEKVLGTIRSRTHHYPFRLIPPGVLRPYLEQLCREEGVSVEPSVFPLVVRAGAGSARDSLSVLDQLIAGADESGVTYARAVNLLGVTDAALIDDMTDALAAGDGAAAFRIIDAVAEAGHDPRRFAADLLERLRDLIILQRVPDAAASGIIEAPGDQLDRMVAQAERMGPATASRLADIAHNGLTEMRGTTAPRLVLELIVARMLLPGADDSHGALLQRLERMERRLGAAASGGDRLAAPAGASTPTPARSAGGRPGAAAASAPPSPGDSTPARPAGPERPASSGPDWPSTATPGATSGATPGQTSRATPGAEPGATPGTEPMAAVRDEPVPDPVKDAPTAAGAPGNGAPGALDAAAVRRVWDEVLTMVRRRSQKAAALAREAIVRDVQGDEIVLVFRHVAHLNMFNAWADQLVDALHEVLGGTWRVRAEPGGEQDPRAPVTSVPSAPAAPPGSASPRPQPSPRAPQGQPAPRPPHGRPAARSSTARTPEPSAPAAPARPSSPSSRARPDVRTAGDADWPTAAAPGAGVPAYDGFDPGDEPLDDEVDPAVARQASHEQAVRLISEHLGAEPFDAAPDG